MRWPCWLLLLAGLVGCRHKDGEGADTGAPDTAAHDTALAGDSATEPGDTDSGEAGMEEDADGDGAVASVDCDDGDASVYPGAEEVPYDGVDQDCDGDDLTDVDGDGADAEEVGGLDCDDDDPAIGPEAYDLPNDGVDQDCDGADALRDRRVLDLADADVILEGPREGGTLGWAVLLGVDHNGDGLGELLASDPGYGNGEVYLFEGEEGGVNGERHATLTGEGYNHELGASLAAAGTSTTMAMGTSG